MARRFIGDVLVQQGLLTRTQVRALLEWQRRNGRRFGELAEEFYYVSARPLYHALALHFGLPFVELAATRPQREVVEWIPYGLVRRYRAVPVRMVKEGTRVSLVVATSDPSQPGMLEALRAAAKMDVQLAVATPKDIDDALVSLGLLPPRREVDVPVDDGKPMPLMGNAYLDALV